MFRFRFVVPVLILVAAAVPAEAETFTMSSTDAMAVRSTRFHMPGVGFQLRYWKFSRFCPQGTPCEQGTVTSGPDSVASVEQLLHLYGDTYTYYDQINVQFLPENGAAHIDGEGDLAPMLVLRPAENVADRSLNFTPACNPYWVEMLNERAWNQRFWVERYKVWTGSIRIKLETDPDKAPAFSSGDDVLLMPKDPVEFRNSNLPALAYVIGHEIMHYAQTLAGNPVGRGISHYHDGCMSASVESSFGEGIADAIGNEYAAWRYGHDPDVDYTPCWKLTYWYKKAEVVGPNYENNQAAFIRSLTKRDRLRFWHTFTTARVAVVTGTTRPIKDGIELLMAVDGGKKLLPDRWIAEPETPAVFPEADSLWQYWVNGVEPAVLALNPNDPNSAGGWEHDPNRFLRKIYPNPTPGAFYCVARAPSSGAIRIELYSVQGRRVHTQDFTGLALGDYRLTISPPHLPSGVYIVRYVDPVNGWVTSSGRVTIVR